jgi:hypothetical protein
MILPLCSQLSAWGTPGHYIGISDQGSYAMCDDDKRKASAESLAEAEKEHQELMAALLKKLDILSSLEEHLGCIKLTQK